MAEKPIIVISATRFFQGGTIVIVNDCLRFLSAHLANNYRIKALVYKKELYEDLPGIEWETFPKSRNSIGYRLYYEYLYFRKLSKKWQPALWLSLQDSTPNVKTAVQAVYFHNPLLLKPDSLKLWEHQFRLSMLWLLYKHVYTNGMNRNNFVFTQQEHIADYLATNYIRDPKQKLRVFPPKTALVEEMCQFERTLEKCDSIETDGIYTFIFPATAFFYKNFQLILSAAEILEEKGLSFKVLLTIDGTENSYAKELVQSAKSLKSTRFLGFLERTDLIPLYKKADCMIFPSYLESWGLPLTEFSQLGKPVLCADLHYGREALASYDKVSFFDPDNDDQLAALMEATILGHLEFQPHAFQQKWPRIHNWAECFALLLDK